MHELFPVVVVVAVSAAAGACWRRMFGGWHPFGISLPRWAWLLIMGAAAACFGLLAFRPWPLSIDSGLLAFAAVAFAYSWTPAHGTDSNRWAFLKSEWIEQPLRYGTFPGALAALPFVFKGAWTSAAVMLAAGILAGLAAALFLRRGPGWAWLPVDKAPHSFADGRMVYNEFALGAILCGGYAAACALAG